jgi:hypothetical protein
VLCYTYIACVVTCDLDIRQVFCRHTAFPVTSKLQKARQALVYSVTYKLTECLIVFDIGLSLKRVEKHRCKKGKGEEKENDRE